LKLPFSLSVHAAAASLAAAALLAFAQSPAPPAPHGHEDHDHEGIPAVPKNLQVLPKNLTGDQVHEIMEGWAIGLGVHCHTCHAENPNDIGPNGRPRLNFADDSRPEKRTARIMYTMMEDINTNYIAKIESSGEPVTCGTCHRGHLAPDPFDAGGDDHQHAQPGHTAPGQRPATPH
jgi:hypothetical protein